MTEIVETGYGKINLALAITGAREDGYHNIDTIFQSIGLCDTVTLREAEEFQLTCSVESLPCDETNLAYRAWKALCPYKKDNHGVAIHIEKRIPIAAGLAGGSTDCAAVLRGLNRLWELSLSQQELCRIGAKLGADVPFCICGGTMRGTGIGEGFRHCRPGLSSCVTHALRYRRNEPMPSLTAKKRPAPLMSTPSKQLSVKGSSNL